MKSKNQIHICFFTTEYAIPEMGRSGGIGVFIKNHANALLKRGIDVTIYSFGHRPKIFKDGKIEIIVASDLSSWLEPLKETYRKSKLPGYISFKVFLSYINRKYISRKFDKYLKNNDFDIVELNDYGGHPTYLKTKLPVVIRCHGSALVLHKAFGYARRAVDIPFEKMLFKTYDQNIVAVSEYSADITQKAFQLKSKPEVIYNGIEIPAKSEMLTDDYLADPVIPFSIFYFGAIRERKGVDVAAKVFNEVVELFPKSTFHVAGSNNNKYWSTVENYILTDLARTKTTYYGNIPNNEINNHLMKAHLVLFPSFGENFSMALLEVMVLGKIVISSNIPSFKEIVEDGKNGFIADDHNDYLEKITWVFNNPVIIETIAENSVKSINSKFSIDKAIERNIEFYASILNKKNDA